MKPACPAMSNGSAIGGDGGSDQRSVPGKGRCAKTALANDEGRFSYFDFCDEDLIRSSSFRNSAVSSSIDLEGGLGGKGITSDMVEPPLVHVRAVCLSSPAIDAFLRRACSRRVGNRHK